MRVFAGPNGSGKSTIIRSVRNYKTANGKLDFGIYVNADDIVNELKSGKFNFSSYQIKTTKEEFEKIVTDSGLLVGDFTKKRFLSSFSFENNTFKLNDTKYIEYLAQAIADFLRKKLLLEKKKFSFETVFSHESKLEIMKQAKAQGYKVYLYFVSTNSPAINKARVELRVKKGGHHVPPDKIESRYYRSLGLLFEAAQYSYQTFFWDNSGDQPQMFKHFKVQDGKKHWKSVKGKTVPSWFIEYYANKALAKKNSK